MKKEKTGKFSYSGYTPEENKEIDRKINSWSKKELVDVIYELAERIDEGEPEKKITQALENFDNAVRTMRLWNEKKPECREMFGTVEQLQEESVIVLYAK